MLYRRIPFSYTLNARDLGGYATSFGATKWNVFFRSGWPVHFDAYDIALLKKLNVTAIIDLRGGQNSDETLPSAKNVKGIEYFNVPLGDGKAPRYAKDVPASYMQIADNKQIIKTLFDIFAQNEGAALFHCFAGKDRTGVVAALLLMLAGVSDMDVIADYTLSYAYFLDRIQADLFRVDAEKDVFIPHPEHMEGFLRLFRAEYGSVQNYLTSAGVTKASQQKIIDKFIQKF
ncbi:MAG: tyrosine-protein phosphatase [Corallococcus sp.]|nr:tyrosine-protein phosphatase [Corallococcus sp.]MCM1359354.1 tyrosine-protein phosphatase [Corallococcus sp.]MCM1394797.1 tyrosine-protein phosphatase [Corallococcus sp.]